MKRFFKSLITIGLTIITVALFAEGPDDQYIRIYNLIREADNYLESGIPREAYTRYVEAQKALQNFKNNFPSWNSEIVEFRLQYVTQKINQFLPGDKQKPITSTNLQEVTQAKIQVIPAQQELEAFKKENQALKDEINALKNDKALLEAKLREALSAQPTVVSPKELTKLQDKVSQLEKENALLKVTIEQHQEKLAKIKDVPDLEKLKAELNSAQQKILQNQKTIELLSQEKSFLQSRVNELEKKGQTSKSISAADSLQKERDELEQKLKIAQKEIQKLKESRTSKRIAELEKQLASLNARLNILDAQAIPYSQEELALLSKPKPELSSPTVNAKEIKNTTNAVGSPVTTPKKAKEIPPGTGPLVAQAQRAFSSGKYDEAEKTFTQILQQDDQNVIILSDLAAVQINQNKLEQAEQNLLKALSIDGEDVPSLSLMGYLKFKQQKYDEALDYLSKAAQLDASDAKVQNYLGIVLAEKGLRKQSETAFRKAIQLNPNYAEAHHNLAVLYADEKPPFIELAKYHYQKACALGHAKNPDLEKLLQKDSNPNQ